jgi:hypothetical protein
MGNVDSLRTIFFFEILQGVVFLKYQFSLKSDNREVRFTCSPIYMYNVEPCLVNGEIMHYKLA